MGERESEREYCEKHLFSCFCHPPPTDIEVIHTFFYRNLFIAQGHMQQDIIAFFPFLKLHFLLLSFHLHLPEFVNELNLVEQSGNWNN
jgi:hypothetical protein